MKKILMVFGIVSLGCIGMEEPIWVTVPGTARQLDLNDKDPITWDIFKELSELEDGVDIVAIPTGGEDSPRHYYEAESLREWVKENLYVNPMFEQLFHREDLKVFNVKKTGSEYVTVEKDVFDVLPQGLVSEKAQEFLDTSRGLHPDIKRIYLEKVAEQDDNPNAKAQAEINLGDMYYNGEIGDAPNYIKAQEYFERAARQMVNLNVKAEAEIKLGIMYKMGLIGDAPNYIKAQECFERAAGQTVNLNVKADAEFSLGVMYKMGLIGDAPNYIKAQEYFERAADQTVNLNVKALAELYLGVMYYNGEIGDAPNYIKAQEYFEKVVEQTVNPNAKAKAESFLQEMRTEDKI